VTYADTQVVASGKPLWTYMRSALQNGVMPLPPVPIDPGDRDALIRWLDAGAPARTASDLCTVPVDPGEGGVGAAESGALDSPDPGEGAVESGITLDARAPDAPDVGSFLDSSADEGPGDAGTDTLDTCSADGASLPCN